MMTKQDPTRRGIKVRGVVLLMRGRLSGIVERQRFRGDKRAVVAIPDHAKRQRGDYQVKSMHGRILPGSWGGVRGRSGSYCHAPTGAEALAERLDLDRVRSQT